MKSKLSFIMMLVLLPVVILSCSQTPQAPAAVNGSIDLSAWNFVKDGPVELTGQWQFYRDKLIVPEKEAEPSLVSVPGVWPHYKKKWFAAKKGAVTYRLSIDLQRDDQVLMLRIPYIFSSYNVYINGNLERTAGVPGLVERSTRPHFCVSYLPVIPHSKKIDLVIQTANFHHAKAGIRDAPQIGSVASIQHIKKTNLFGQLSVFIILMVLSFYHFLHYFMRDRDAAQMALAAASFIFALRVGFTGELVLHDFFGLFDWFTQVRLEWLMPYTGSALIACFFISTFSDDTNPVINKIIYITGVISFVFVLVAPHTLFTSLLPILGLMSVFVYGYILIILFKAIKEKRKGSMVLLAGSLITIIFILNDFLYASDIIYTGFYLNYGILIFFFSHSWVISSFHARSYRELQQVSEELLLLNQTLEDRVEKRTEELYKKNKDLQAAFESIKTLKGFIPICSSCKKVRDDDGYWQQVEHYIRTNSDAQLSHGICPDCVKKLYPDLTEKSEKLKKYTDSNKKS